jgi:DNA-directed RNA polymerase specialized sigma subunit
VNGKKCSVSKDVYKTHRKFNNKLRYSEYTKKAEKVSIDENGKITVELSAEESVEHLSDINRQLPDNQPSVESLIETKMMIDYALSFLPPKDKMFIDLHYYKGCSMAEMAKIRQTSLRNIYKIRDRILCTLNEILSK